MGTNQRLGAVRSKFVQAAEPPAETERARRPFVPDWIHRLASTVAGVGVGVSIATVAFAIVEEAAPPPPVIDVSAGVVVGSAANLAPAATSPPGTAIPPAPGVSGPQGEAFANAAMNVTSAGRTAGQFSVTPTGAATYNIPIWTPPGAREIEPHLALHYISGGPDSAMGPGWALIGMSAIARCAKTFASNGGSPAPVVLATTDDLCLDGNRLRLTSGTQGVAGSTYQTEFSTFSQITAYGATGNGPSYFIVQGKDGRSYEYGNGSNSQAFATGATTPYAWGLDKVYDRQGNNMVLAYNTGTTLNVATIQYTATPGTGATYGYEVAFTYAPRTGGSTITKYVAGSVVSQSSQLTNIGVTSTGTSVRQYYLTYAASPTTNRPLLNTVQECGGSAGTDCLRPTTIAYQSGGSAWGTTAASTGLTGQYGFMTPDLNGDGIPDALYGKLSGSTISWYARIATVSGSYGAEISTGATTTTTQPGLLLGNFDGTGKTEFLAPVGSTQYAYRYNGSGFTATNTNVTAPPAYVVDWDGDGLPDLVEYTSLNTIAVIRNTTTAGGSISFSSSPQTVWTNPTGYQFIITQSLLPFDFNGDGRADLLVRIFKQGPHGTSVFQDYTLLSNGFSTAPTQINLNAQIENASENGGSASVAVGDWNGDGCTDLVTPKAVLVSDCAGHFVSFAINIPLLSSPPFPYPIELVDFDGDGQMDLLYPDPTSNTWHVARSTGAGMAAGVATGIAYSSSAGISPADMNSDGQPDLLTINAASGYAVSYYPHLSFGTPPDLANSISDGFGINFSPLYLPISQSNYTKGTSSVFPDIDFQGPLYVVSQFTASDGLGGTYTNSFYYYWAVLNLQGRGFEGYGATRQWDNRNGVYQYTYYYNDFPYTGEIWRADVVQPDAATLMRRTQNTWAASTLAGQTNANCATCYFPYISNATVTNYEVGGAKNGELISTASTNYTYDVFGSLTNTTSTLTDNDNATAPVSPFAGQQWITTIANTVFNDTSSKWCIGRPSLSSTTKTVPGQPAQTRTVSHTLEGTNCRATAETIEPGDPKLQVTTTFGFDACGNTNNVSVVGLDQNGVAMPARITQTSYGTRCQFPESVTNPYGQTTTAYNYGLGVKSSMTDPNLITVSWLYDDFGRKTKETRPDSTYVTWAYSDCVSTSCWGLSDLRLLVQETMFSSAGSQIRIGDKFYDGMDRLRFDEGNRVLGTWTNKTFIYDNLGRKTNEVLPYSSASNGYHYYSYDLGNRVTADTLYEPGGTAYRTISMGYLGQTISVTDPRGNKVSKVSDVSGKIRQVIDPSPGGTTKYTFDPFDNLIGAVDATGASSSYGYNIRGFKTSSVDADSGSWTFTPDSLNELMTETDANGHITSMTYDLVGRMLTRLEAESPSTTTWTYGTSAAAHNIGRLQSVSKPDGYAESYAYDSFGRPQTTVYTEDGVGYQFDYSYNVNGTLDTLTYPTSTSGVRFALKHLYDTVGYLNQVKDASAGTIFWTLNAASDSSLPTTELLGNAVQVSSTYTPWTDELITRQEGPAAAPSSLQNLSYTWDLAGNLYERQDLRQGLAEVFTNDPLNRLTNATLNGTPTLAVQYDAAGNIVNKNDVGSANYVYGDPAHKHAVTAAGSWTMTYDANGNMISRAAGSISWYSYNLPNQITYGTNSAQFSYNSNHQRWKQVANYSGTQETVHYVGGLLEVMNRGSVTEYRHQIPAGSSTAIYDRRTDGTTSTYYASSDHLGSSDLVLDSSGNVLARESFTPFGARRGSNWQGAPTTQDFTAFTNTTRRGFTGHEMLDAVSLIHMNGRVYDPYLGRFLSADSVVQSLASSQSINPYAYAWNDPLRYVDPSGHSLLGSLVGLVVAIIAAIIIFETCGAGGALVTEAGTLSANGVVLVGFVGGFVGAYVSTGYLPAALLGGILGGMTAGLFNAVGAQGAANDWGVGARSIAHAAVGCFVGATSGGNCGKGAVSAAVTEYLGSQVLHGDNLAAWGSLAMLAQVAKYALIGGLASRLQGEKFADGFTLGGASYLFNELADPPPPPKVELIYRSPYSYNSPDDAAKAAIGMADAMSDTWQNEYGGTINYDGTHYSFTICRGDPTHVDYLVSPTRTVALWHTHPASDVADNNEENMWLSSGGEKTDIEETTRANGITGRTLGVYLRTPSYMIKFFPDAVTNARIYQSLGTAQ